MRVTSIRLNSFRSFADSGEIELGQLNVLIGANNSGKSSVLRGLHQIQEGLVEPFGDVRVDQQVATIIMKVTNPSEELGKSSELGPCLLRIELHSRNRTSGSITYVGQGNGNNHDFRPIPALEPNHFIVPYWSKRKVYGYSEDVSSSQVMGVNPSMQNLPAKLSRLANPAYPFHKQYAEASKAILGFVVTAITSERGQRVGVYLPDGTTLPIDQMGEGVPNIVHMLSYLAISKNKLFLVEEPENDLHPTALKSLLNLIIASSESNQFVITTHSNIVVRHLCGAPDSRLYRVVKVSDSLPTESKVEAVDNQAESRIAVLQELGYSFSDFDLWDGWLILEESSAERIIRDYLIPWFVPKLSRLRTMAVNGASKIEAAFDDFQRLVLFTYLQPIYRNKAWV